MVRGCARRLRRTSADGHLQTKHRNLSRKLVLLGRIELPTSPLPRVRSTTELQQHP